MWENTGGHPHPPFPVLEVRLHEDDPDRVVAESIFLRSTRPVLFWYPRIRLDVPEREPSENEFIIAEKFWFHYHSQKAEMTPERIFAVFVEETPAGVARSRRHPDSNEVDGVFVLYEFMHYGYDRRLMQALIGQCVREIL